MRLYLSPSNQPHNKYIYMDLTEKQNCEKIAILLSDKLKKDYDIEIELATFDLAIGDKGRSLEAYNKRCDFYLAIHTNAAGGINISATGAVGIYNSNQNKGKQLMTAMVGELTKINPIKSNRVTPIYHQNSLIEINSPMNFNIESSLIEIDFHDNIKTVPFLINQHEQITDAMIKSIINTFIINRKQETKQPIYRVRTTWDNANSQLGAFTELENAKKSIIKTTKYKIYNEKGVEIYP